MGEAGQISPSKDQKAFFDFQDGKSVTVDFASKSGQGRNMGRVPIGMLRVDNASTLETVAGFVWLAERMGSGTGVTDDAIVKSLTGRGEAGTPENVAKVRALVANR